MAKILLLQGQQCELIDYSQENPDLTHYTLLTNDSREYTAIIATLDENATEELTNAVELGHIFYKLSDISHYYIAHHVTDSDKPKSTIPFMDNEKKPTAFAQPVLENLYEISTDKGLLLIQIEAGEFSYSIFDTTEIIPPKGALPLFIYPPTQSSHIKKAWKNNPYYFLLNHVKDNPEVILKCVFYFAVIYYCFSFIPFAAAQQPKENKLDKTRDTLSKATRLTPTEDFTLKHGMKLVTEQETNDLKNAKPIQSLGSEAIEELFYSAIINDDVNFFQAAIQQGYIITKPNKKGTLTFFLAAEKNSINILRYAHQVLNINLNVFQSTKHPLRDSLLIIAIDNGHNELVKQLIQWGVEVNPLIDNGKSLLHYIASMSPHTKNQHRLEQLVALGADINQLDNNGESPVFSAGRNNNIPALKFLLAQKCKTSFGKLPDVKNLLTICMEKSSLETVEVLLKHGLDPQAYLSNQLKNDNFWFDAVPLSMAVKRRDQRFINLLVQYNVDIAKYPDYSSTLMVAAFKSGSDEVMYSLLRQNVRLDKLNVFVKYESHTFTAIEQMRLQTFLNTASIYLKYMEEFLKNRAEETAFFKDGHNIEIDKLTVPFFIKAHEQYKNYKEYQAKLDDYHSTLTKIKYALIQMVMALLIKGGINITSDFFSFLSSLFYNKKNITLKTTNTQPIITDITNDKPQDLTLIKMVNEHINEIDNLIMSCKHEKENIIMAFTLRNQANIYKKYKNVEPEKGLRDIQLKYNESIKLLHGYSCTLDDQLKSPYVGDQGLEILNTCESALEKMRATFTTCLNEMAPEEIKMLCRNTKYNIQANIIDACKNFRKTIFLTIRQANQAMDNIDNLEIEIKKRESELQAEKMIPQKTYIPKQKTLELIIKTKPAKIKNQNNIDTNHSIKSTSKEKLKYRATNNTNKNSIVNVSIFSSDLCTPQMIMEDNRVFYACELLLTLENIKNGNNVSNEYKEDAALYLLMKSSHLLSQIIRKYKTIIIDNNDCMSNLRNNIVHYPESCLHNNELMQFLADYCHIFITRLISLRDNGKCHMIETDILYNQSSFMLSDNRNLDQHHSLQHCLLAIETLCKKAANYYLIGDKLDTTSKYTLNASLHSAMHIIILKLREALNILRNIDENAFTRINYLLPDIIETGNHIAHNSLDEEYHHSSIILEGREFYAQQDISEYALLGIMKQIRNKLESVYFVCEDVMLENPNLSPFL